MYFLGRVLGTNSTNQMVQAYHDSDIVKILDDTDSISQFMQLAKQLKSKGSAIAHYIPPHIHDFIQRPSFDYLEKSRIALVLQVLCVASQNEYKRLDIFKDSGNLTISSISNYLTKSCQIPEADSKQLARGFVVMCTHTRENWSFTSNPLTESADFFMTNTLSLRTQAGLFQYSNLMFSWETLFSYFMTVDLSAKYSGKMLEIHETQRMFFCKELRKMTEQAQVFPDDSSEEEGFVSLGVV